MSIKDNLNKMHVAVVTDTFNGGNLGSLLRATAVNALTNGRTSDEWKEYMTLFADNEEQLMRLTAEGDNDPGWFREQRAYIVSNAICGADTNGQTGAHVEDAFSADPTLSNTLDHTVDDRPFAVPDVAKPPA